MRSMGTRRKSGLDCLCADADGDGKYLGDGADGVVWGTGDAGDGAVAGNAQGDTRVPIVETGGVVWSECDDVMEPL